jgi:hypothetical protein
MQKIIAAKEANSYLHRRIPLVSDYAFRKRARYTRQNGMKKGLKESENVRLSCGEYFSLGREGVGKS